MDDPLIMHFLQRIGDGEHQLKDRLRLEHTVLPEVYRQINTVEIFHDDVCGAVFFKILSYINDTGDIHQLSDLSGFLQKVFQSLFEEGYLIVGGRRYQLTDIVVTVDISVREVFLDGNTPVERQIPTDIGDTEPTFADTVADQKFLVENGAGLEPVCD